ncbi:Voltage-gated potassium channel subunit beta-3 [Orchesella cincta]|uniref:Voltage-gated potassium channel subunit beta-3 n=1 Tax=Orchesella cincta TaxID=48709 RepID=A0A1D2MDB8_ORCCI|nr:Voltage-gated potassium channel subunit beta-3 [Orchesella cincta]
MSSHTIWDSILDKALNREPEPPLNENKPKSHSADKTKGLNEDNKAKVLNEAKANSSDKDRTLNKNKAIQAPLACNEEGFDEMEQLFLPDSNRSMGPMTNGTTPQQSPLPASGRNPTPGLRYRNLGKSGLRVSSIGLATWMLTQDSNADSAEKVITLAYESGINVFDLSEAYSGQTAEEELGKILQKKAWKRTSYNVVTKIYWTSK